jgi:hypothetical protein
MILAQTHVHLHPKRHITYQRNSKKVRDVFEIIGGMKAAFDSLKA